MTSLKLFFRTGTYPTLLPSFSSVMASQASTNRLVVKPYIHHKSTDMSAAKHAHVLFVKEKPGNENDLATYCNNEGIKHILFSDFSKALPVVQSVVIGTKTIEEVLAIGTA